MSGAPRNALDPTYKDIEICACSTPGWTHHSGFHAFVADRERRAVKAVVAALGEVGQRDLVGDHWTTAQVAAWRGGRDSTIAAVLAALDATSGQVPR